MSNETVAQACALLSRMQSETPWNEGLEQLYEVGLRSIPELFMMDVVTRAVLTRPTRPSVAELMQIAEEVLDGPRQSAADAWEEVEQLLQTRGAYCVQDPYRPNIFREGTPRFSSNLVEQTVARMGGWSALCAFDGDPASLRGRFMAVYQEVADHSRRFMRHVLAAPPQPVSAPAQRKRAVLRVAHGR